MFKRPDLKLTDKYLSLHAINPFVEHNSSSRSVMMGSHISQSLITEGCNEKLVQSGAEREFGKYTISVKFPVNARIIKVLPRYRTTLDKNGIPYNPELIVIFEDLDTREIGYVSVPDYKSLHTYFGYRLKKNDSVMSRIRPGVEFEKDTIIADSVSKGENGSYNYGTSLNTVFMSHPAVSEDGVIISETTAEKLAFRVYEKRVVEFNHDEIPLNIYGDLDVYKCFPEIGEYVNPDGVVMATRPLSESNSYNYGSSKEGTIKDTAVKMSTYDVMEYDPLYDNVVYIRGEGGKVIDVKVYHNPTPGKQTYPKMTEQANKYAKALLQFYQELVMFDRKMRMESKKKHGKDTIIYRPELHVLMLEAYAIYNKHFSKNRREQSVRFTYRKEPVKEYRVELTVEYIIKPTVGFKLSDSHGGKGVIVKVMKDEDMPVDQYGNRADVIMDSGATISRMNLGRLYEHYYSHLSTYNRSVLIQMLGVDPSSGEDEIYDHIMSLWSDKINQTWEWLLGLFQLVSEKQFTYFSKITALEDRVEYLSSVCKKALILYYPIGNHDEPVLAIKTIEASPYKPPKGPVTYTNDHGERITTVEDVRIAPMYVLILEKIADKWLSAASAKIQMHGLPISVSKKEKHRHPWNYTPVRIMGESECRLMLAYTGRRGLAEVIDRSGSVLTHKHVYRGILDSPQPGNIQNLVNRHQIPYGGNKALEMFKHISTCAGWEATYEKE